MFLPWQQYARIAAAQKRKPGIERFRSAKAWQAVQDKAEGTHSRPVRTRSEVDLSTARFT